MAPLYNTRETFNKTALYTTTPPVPTSKDNPSASCSICTSACIPYSPISTHHALQMPSCNHVFGASCIQTWFDKASTCPLCRKDFFPMAPEEISPEVEQVTDMFVETFNLLRDMERRYPQGRKALDKARTALTVFGDMVVKDVDKRAERKEMGRKKEQRRVAAEEIQRVARQLVDLHDALREDEDDASQAEQVPPPNAVATVVSTESMPPEPTVSPRRTMQQDDTTEARLSTLVEIEAFLAYDFSHDLVSLSRDGQFGMISDNFTRLARSEALATRAEHFGLEDAAHDVRRKSASVIDTMRLEVERRRVQEARRKTDEQQRVKEERRSARHLDREGKRRVHTKAFTIWCLKRSGKYFAMLA